MPRYPGALWRGPVPNQGGTLTPRIGVAHIMAGTLLGTDSWFHNPASQVSAHFGIGREGAVYQWVDTAVIAWHVASDNAIAIGIEHEGQSGDALTPAMVDADVALVSWIEATHGVPLLMSTQRGWCGHGQLGAAGGNHPACPGQPVLDQWPTVLARAAGATPTPTPTGGPLPMAQWNNPTTVRWCYLEYLAREPDPGGLQTWTDYLDSGGDLGNMIALFVDQADNGAGTKLLNVRRQQAGLPLIGS